VGAEASTTSLDDARRRRRGEELTREHGAYLRALARKLCRSQLDPDDLVQDVLERVLRTELPAGANERAWLSRVMQNLFVDKLRRRAARPEQPVVDEPVAAIAEDRAWWEALTESEVRAKLAQLPDEQRVTFELFAFEGKSYDEIAAKLKIAKATVGTRILRARTRLRELFTSDKERGDG
jgi:RNA polymerase sigma-70 factor (ECF subfamily)